MNITVSLLGTDALSRISADRLAAPLVAAVERELMNLDPNASRAEREAALAEAVARVRILPATQTT